MATANPPDLDTAATVVIGAEQVPVLVCGLDERRGVRVTNRMWGGRLDAWVPLNDITVTIRN